MIKKAFALFAVLLLLAGCPGNDDGLLDEGTGGGSTGGTGSQEHISIENGTSSQISAGEYEEGEFIPASEYAENVNSSLFIYFISVGYGDTQGDAILVKKGDFDMVIDGGPVAKKYDVVNFLLAKGVDDIEVLVSTHEDAEHYGGLSYIGEQFRVAEVWRPAEGSESYSSMLEEIGAEDGVKYVGLGDSYEFNGMSVSVLNPIKGEGRFFDSDNDGVVLRIEDRGFCILLDADIDSSAQTKVLTGTGTCDVVQMPWHGMSEGLYNLDFFFDVLEPQAAIISGSASDWTKTRQTLFNKAALRGIGIYPNYNGTGAKVTFDGYDFAITIEE
ncbi:MBL fold metallo-hydrolase [Candidatus Micrarchaeota archaeon]|nr:MBL fold metallo-hydrolase [Candidatus Micrarchaeota archaeon]